MNPRPYQREAAEAAVARARETGRALVVLPTGTGKSLTMQLCAQAFVGQRPALVLAHRDEILGQLQSRLERAGFDVRREQGRQRARLCQMRIDGANGRPQAVVASVQSMRGKRLAGWPSDAFGVILVDEAHHAIARTWAAVLDHFDAPAIGFTATALRQGLGDLWGDEPAYTMGIQDAINGGWLVPMRVLIVELESLDFRDIRKLYGNQDIPTDDLARLMDVAMPEALAQLVAHGADHKVLAFWPNVRAAQAAAEHLRSVGWRGEAIWGDQALLELRRQHLQQFRDGRLRFLSNCDVLSEGVDLPEASLVACFRVTRSDTLLMQQVGRGLRPHPVAEIDAAASAEERRARIEASPKPHALVMIAKGTGAKFDVASIVALQRGWSRDDARVAEIEAQMAGEAKTVDQAEADLAAEREAARLNAERERFERELADRVATAKRMARRAGAGRVREVDPGELGATMATEAQYKYVYRLTIQMDGKAAAREIWRRMETERWTKQRASGYIQHLRIKGTKLRVSRAARDRS